MQELKWYAALMVAMMIILGAVVLSDTFEKGPIKCAEACKLADGVMARWGVVYGCACVGKSP